ncbi:MAG: ABC transporter permease [Tenuifilaceae bacterium]|jgi:putative ABC transport system permease protein|nr:ABC transporter permease [Tenuifilaceae bacterium]
MLTYNLKTAIKFLRKNKAFATINLIGLSIALAVSFIIILYVVNELTYDSCHSNRKNISRIITHYANVDYTTAGTPYILSATLKEDFPQVKSVTNTRQIREFRIKSTDQDIHVANPVGTSSEIFNIFSIHITSSVGNAGFLDDDYSICLSQSLANKIFGDEDAIGKDLTIIIDNEEIILRITAVYKDIPENSSLKAECLVNGTWAVKQLNRSSYNEGNSDINWTDNYWTTWVMLDENAHSDHIEAQFRNLENKYLGKNNILYSLQNLSEVYLKSENIENTGQKGNMKNVKLFSTIAILLVLVAAINYIILSTAVYIGRINEIAIRKTNGARGSNILHQLLTESILLVLLVLPIAFFLMMQGLPYASVLFQKQLHIIPENITLYILVYLSLTLLIGGISGVYTSLWFSRQKVMDFFNRQASTGQRKNYLRSTLIILQLVIFCSFVSSMLIVRAQHQYALNMSPGFHKHNVLFIDIGDEFVEYNALLQEIRSNPNVLMAGGTYETLPTRATASAEFPSAENPEVMVMVSIFDVDYHFLETVGIKLVEGRYFSENLAGDSTSRCIFNEAAIKKLGIKDPVGKVFLDTWEIIGVVNDFYSGSILNEVQPTIIVMTNSFIEQIAIQYLPGTLSSLLPSLQDKWNELAPDVPFRYSLVEDLVHKLYLKEKNLTLVVSLSALFTLIIAMFGLFGLTLFTAQRRTKEIGIRKVLGSSASQIIFSFIKTNLLYVLIAVALSTPITILVMLEWLNNYAERIEIGWWIFALTFAIAALVVVITVLAHSYRAARVNPVEALRYE